MWNFSGRFTKSNFIWFSIHINIIYHQTDEAWIYIPGPPGNSNSNQMKTQGLLMDDLKVYSTSHQQLEKVIQQAAYVMEKTGFNLGLDKCSVLTIKARKKCTTKSVKITDEKIFEGLKEAKVL